MPASFDRCSVSCSALLYVQFRGCTGLNSDWAENITMLLMEDAIRNISSSPFSSLPFGWGLVGNLLRYCPLPSTITNPPTPSREPWEAESHHHGDLNTDPPHTGPLWLACVEVRGNKMSQQQVFLCFCFCLNSPWDCSQIHALSDTGGTAVETVQVTETSWFEKWIEWHGNRL